MKNFGLVILMLIPLLGISQEKNPPIGSSMLSWMESQENTTNNNSLLPTDDPLGDYCTIINPVVVQAASPTNADGIFSDIDCHHCLTPNTPQVLAENFFLTADTEVGSVCWSGYFFDEGASCDPVPTDAFTVTYYSSTDPGGGEPMTILATFPGVQPTTTASGNTVAGADQYVFTLDHMPIDLLADTEYWIAIYTNNPDDCDFAWDVSIDPDGDEFSVLSTSMGEPFTWLGSGSDFSIVIGSTAPIPTLSQWGAIILGFLILIFGVVSVKYVNRSPLSEG